MNFAWLRLKPLTLRLGDKPLRGYTAQLPYILTTHGNIAKIILDIVVAIRLNSFIFTRWHWNGKYSCPIFMPDIHASNKSINFFLHACSFKAAIFSYPFIRGSECGLAEAKSIDNYMKALKKTKRSYYLAGGPWNSRTQVEVNRFLNGLSTWHIHDRMWCSLVWHLASINELRRIVTTNRIRFW